MSDAIVSNAVAYSLQVAWLAFVASLLPLLLRVGSATLRYRYWRSVLAISLLLPWLQGREHVHGAIGMSFGPPAVVVGVAATTSNGLPIRTAFPWLSIVIAIVVGGIVLRLAALGVGMMRVRRMRMAGAIAPPSALSEELQAALGTHAEIRYVATLEQPVTFGLRRPIVLLPETVRGEPEAIQRAVLCHELLHVKRRDWVWVIAEAIVRAVLWFHPGVWWLIGRIRVSREQVVDRAAIELTDSRESYVDALLAVARSRLPRILVPAAPFLRRTALKERVACILQETSMTTRRLIATMTASAAVLALTGTMAVRAFPLQADEPSTTGTAAPTALTAPTAQGSQDAGQDAPAPVQIVRGGEHLLHGMTPEYPKQAIEKRIEGEVVLDLSLDERGEVSDARVVSGPEELRRVALASVLQWHYSPAALRSTSVQVALQFHVPPPNAELERRGYALKRVSLDVDAPTTTRIEELEHMLAEAYAMMQRPDLTNEQRDELKAKALEAQKRLEKMRAGQSLARVREESGNPPSIDGRLVRVITERVPREAVQELMTQVGLSVGDPITRDTIQRIVKVAESLDEHIRVNVRKTEGGVILVLVAP